MCNDVVLKVHLLVLVLLSHVAMPYDDSHRHGDGA